MRGHFRCRPQYDAAAVRALITTALVVLFAASLSACGWGSEKVEVPADDPNHAGAVLFSTHCSACHTLTAAGTQGTGNRGQRTQGPDLNQRQISYEDALFAIQNGGVSGAIMPQNIVVGDEAEAVARFLAEYAGEDAGDSDTDGGTDAP